MNALSIMIVAGEPSGDMLGAELVKALRAECRAFADGTAGTFFEPRFFGAGGALMREAGVETVVDMTSHSVIGLAEALRKLQTYRGFFNQLVSLALERHPDLIVCVDFSGFNRRLGHAIRTKGRARGQSWFQNWNPKLVQYVSPQVWASRPGRADKMVGDFDLVLSIFPFEPAWYKKRTPTLNVQFVGHPLLDRQPVPEQGPVSTRTGARFLLLPGSRKGELKRHLPVLREAWPLIRAACPGAEGIMVLPNASLGSMAKVLGLPEGVSLKIGGLHEELVQADVALASTGTVTMECALFKVPTVAFYITSWSTYHIGKRIVTVKFLAMPNILADEAVFPEFVQQDATPQNVAKAGLDLLNDKARRESIRSKLHAVIESLGGAGASSRAAKEILGLFR